MKIKNIAIGDFVQVKKSICRIEFEAEEICEVIDIDRVYKHGFDVLIQGKNGLYWVNHKDLKKPIKREPEPEPQLKQIDHSVFDGVFNWVKSAAVNPDGSAYLFSVGKDDFYDISDRYGFQVTGRDKCKCIGLGYDASNWQNSLIERDTAKELLEVDLSSELTGSELCRAMLERGDKCVMIRMGARDDKQARDIGRFAIATSIDESGRFNVMSDQQSISKVDFAIPINNQGEPLTASEAGL